MAQWIKYTQWIHYVYMAFDMTLINECSLYKDMSQVDLQLSEDQGYQSTLHC